MNTPQSPPPNDLVRAQLVAEQSQRPIRVIIEPSRAGWLGKILKWGFTLLLVVLVLGSYQNYSETEGGAHERFHSLNKDATNKVAIITVEGTILGEDGFPKKQIDQVRDDEHVKAIVLRIDSPGGTVTGSDYLYHHLKKLAEEKEIPLVVSMGSVAASGGYYIAMAAGDIENSIFAEPTTWTGSIGVIIPHYDLSGLLDKLNVQDDSIASHPLKMMGSPTRKFPEEVRSEEEKILKGLVDASFEGFKEIVLASRSALRADKALQEVAFSGRIFTAKQAQENHLVDQLGFIEDAIDRAIELAKLNKHQVKVVKYHRPHTLMEQLFSDHQSRTSLLDPSALLDLASPKAYYLCTWLPGIGTRAERP